MGASRALLDCLCHSTGTGDCSRVLRRGGYPWALVDNGLAGWNLHSLHKSRIVEETQNLDIIIFFPCVSCVRNSGPNAPRESPTNHQTRLPRQMTSHLPPLAGPPQPRRLRLAPIHPHRTPPIKPACVRFRIDRAPRIPHQPHHIRPHPVQPRHRRDQNPRGNIGQRSPVEPDFAVGDVQQPADRPHRNVLAVGSPGASRLAYRRDGWGWW